VGLIGAAQKTGEIPVIGLGPALSLAGLLVAATLLVAEIATRDVTLTLVGGPLAAVATAVSRIPSIRAASELAPAGGALLVSHITLSFLGIAAFATAAAAGAMYLLERRELRLRRFGAVLRFFPPLETLDRVNHISVLVACLALTVGILLATTYSIVNRTLAIPEVVWGTAAWLTVTALAYGRLRGGWQARRAALAASVMFVVIIALYVAVRMNASVTGSFL
jgi:ABC-type transport system involved in cytochrome c biogenesis permease subunit